MPGFASVRLPAWLAGPLQGAVSRLEFSFDPSLTVKRLKLYNFTWKTDGQYLFLLLLAVGNLVICASPGLLGKLLIVAGYTAGVLIPFTSQFVLPATPIFSWLLLFWSSKYTIAAFQPHIWVSVLPTLESVLYGANISDILTRYTSSTLDILAWIPYGVLHFSLPFVTAFIVWCFGPPGAVKFFAKVFGYMNLVGVMIQIAFPCAPPWYELLYGQTPANYAMKGSPGGLARIDALFHSSGYTTTFTNSPMVFGAFPSLHAGCSTTDALLLNHFFPKYRIAYVIYVLWLYWSTMYLTHHYLIDLVAGAGLAVGTFYFFLNEDPYIRDFAMYLSPNKARGGATNGQAYSNGVSGVDEENLYKFSGDATGIAGPEDFGLPMRDGRESSNDQGSRVAPSLSRSTSASRAVSPRNSSLNGPSLSMGFASAASTQDGKLSASSGQGKDIGEASSRPRTPLR